MDNWIKKLGEIFNHLDTSLISEKYLFRFRNAQHIVDIGYEDKIPSMQTPCNKVYLSNFSQIFPMDRGTNYAIRDGKVASDLIISNFAGTPEK